MATCYDVTAVPTRAWFAQAAHFATASHEADRLALFASAAGAAARRAYADKGISVPFSLFIRVRMLMMFIEYRAVATVIEQFSSLRVPLARLFELVRSFVCC